MNFDVEVYREEDGKNKVFICANEGASGAEYLCESPDDVGKAISFYISAYYPDIFDKLSASNYN